MVTQKLAIPFESLNIPCGIYEFGLTKQEKKKAETHQLTLFLSSCRCITFFSYRRTSLKLIDSAWLREPSRIQQIFLVLNIVR